MGHDLPDLNDYVILDIETTGLNRDKHNILEVAYAIGDGPIKTLYPEFSEHTFFTAQPEALDTNLFFERFPGDPDVDTFYYVPQGFADFDNVVGVPYSNRFGIYLSLPVESTDGEWAEFADAVHNRTIVGANPRFDMNFLDVYFDDEIGYELKYPHRLFDIQNYYAGQNHLPKPPSFRDICLAMGIEPGDHRAARDVEQTREVLRMLVD